MDQKAIDGMTNIPIIASSMKAYEVQKYFSLTKHMYNPLVVLISKKAWDKLNNDERALITQAVVEAKEHQRKLLPDFTAKALADLKEHGMVVNEVPAQEIARMREKTKPVLAKYAPQIGEALVRQANDQLAAMRK
jgi:TRAP-type C4-dicarboxylate transport system substrate-binding protein